MKRPVLAGLAILLLALPAAGQQQNESHRAVNVQLTFHLIEADGFTNDDPEIRPVVTELRKLFRFEGYRLASKSVLHATANPGSTVGQQVADESGRLYRIGASTGMIGSDLGLTVELQEVGGSTLIDASVRLQDGRTVVLGTARLSGQSGALILAVTPTIES